MSHIRPEDIEIRAVSQSLALSNGYDLVFGAGDYYQAYLFALFHSSLEGSSVIGAGCSEAEVEDLAKSCRRPCGLLVTDCVAGVLGDAGESMVERIKEGKSETLAVLIASERGEVLLSQGRLGVYDGIVSIHSVHRGGVLKAVEHVLGGKGKYRDWSREEGWPRRRCEVRGCCVRWRRGNEKRGNYTTRTEAAQAECDSAGSGAPN